MKLLVVLAITTSLSAQSALEPNVRNGKFERQAFSGDLDSALRTTEAAWFGYAIATMHGDHENCCFDNGRESGCALEGGTTHNMRGSVATPIQLEGPDRITVLFRVENNRVEKVRIYSMACPLDAGGRRFIWLTDVPAQASLRYLEKLAKSDDENQVRDGAVLAISEHDTPQADDTLERLTESHEPVKLREKATFWLGANRGARGVEILKNIVAHDDNEQVRDKAVFALSISKRPEAASALIAAAEHDPSPHVRGQALFWLAQKAGAHAAAAIQNAIENDPDTEVKKRAVFAMSQLPKDESVPKLIEIARTQRNPEVRKQAFFWLGQSNDPRALAFFEQVLLK
jgi:HEAT repeat protein